MITSADLKVLTAKLQDASSVKRRSAAKKLRRYADSRACAELLSALRREVLDERTWETQYQLIMALGTCGCENALPMIRSLAQAKFWATMRQMAVGDALLRLLHTASTGAAPFFEVLEIARSHDAEIAAGAMRAVAMLRLQFDSSTAEQVIKTVDEFGHADVIFWTVAASPGWPAEVVRPFLERCLKSPNEWTRVAADSALRGKYETYNPL